VTQNRDAPSAGRHPFALTSPEYARRAHVDFGRQGRGEFIVTTREPGRELPVARDPYRVFSPGGESWATFLARAGGALSRLVARHRNETVVAVCHAGVVEASFALAFGLGASANRVDCAPLNTSLTHWRHRAAPAGEAEWALISFNDASHLIGSGQPPFLRASTSPATSTAPAPTSTRAISRNEKPSE
jgi:hypothetical protein